MSSRGDRPAQEDANVPAPDWVVEGLTVEHAAFGRGVVTHVGLYKDQHTIWINFGQVGEKALMPLYAMPHLRKVNER